ERTDHGGTATLTIVFKSSDPAGRQTARALPVDQLDAYTVPRLDRTVLDDINRKIARRYAGAWLAGEEPPAPAVRRPRAPKAPEELKATAHQLRTLEREADALDAGPLKEEAGVFQATPGTSAAASGLAVAGRAAWGPPAPAVRPPRAPKAPAELKATAHQLRTLEREADALDAGPLKEEAGVFQATPGTSAAASDLIERVTAQVAA